MTPPFISYVAFNRLGLTAASLKSILATSEDFEMHIIDSNSKDNTWDFLQSLKDERIKSITKFPVNAGPIYALNFNLAKRRPDQYFFTIDSDVCIETNDWITRFMTIFNAFPNIGVLGMMRPKPYLQIYPEVTPRVNGSLSCLELKNGFVDVILDFAHGCLMCLKPELISEIGYWSEENCFGDAEICPRVNNYTSYRVGFMSDINYKPIVDITMEQQIACDQCSAQEFCKLIKENKTCFVLHTTKRKNESFVNKFKWKYLETFKELEEGKRTAYCASIFDPKSTDGHLYHRDWALENFSFYIENAN